MTILTAYDPHALELLGADHPVLVAFLVLGLIALFIVSVAAVVAIVRDRREGLAEHDPGTTARRP